MEFNGFSKDLNKVEYLRRAFVSDFSRETINELSLEQYAMGRGDKNSFCYRLEYEQEGMGRISSSQAGSQKYGVWYNRKIDNYTFTKKYGQSVSDAFFNVKNEIVKLLNAGEVDDYFSIIESPLSDLLKYKILAMYYPQKYLTIYTHLPFFCHKVGIPACSDDKIIVMQQKLLQWKKSNEETRGFSLLEFVDYLYVVFGRPDQDDSSKIVKTMSYEEMLKRLRDFDGKHPNITQSTTEIIKRSKLVSETAKARAGGYCQLCESVAPFFYQNGKPYLECHHIISLANNGADELENVVALCPNCHRKIHYLNDPNDIKKLRSIANKV